LIVTALPQITIYEKEMSLQKLVIIEERRSTQADLGGLILSAVQTRSDRAQIVVGRPGFPNVEATLTVGGAILFETPDGLFEVRVMSTTINQVEVLISQISPMPGIAGGFVDKVPENTPFSTDELKRIASSLENIRLAMNERSDVTPEQLDFISRKLDEMQAASERLGRKDWMNLAIGTLTSIIVTAALASTVAKALLQAASATLSWVFGGIVKLLP